jgi:hypothetical protein
MAVEMVRIDGVDLCVETFAERVRPRILLILGAAESMEGWPPTWAGCWLARGGASSATTTVTPGARRAGRTRYPVTRAATGCQRGQASSRCSDVLSVKFGRRERLFG